MPKLRFKGFEEAWEEVQLGEVVSFRKGKGIAKTDISDSGEPCILYGELYTKYNEVIDRIQSKTDVSINNPIIGKVNDVLIPASGETALDIATASSLTVDNVLIGGDINLLTPKEGLNGLFISYQINNKQKKELAKFAEGASVVHLYKDGIAKLKIHLPIHKEQVKISEFLKLMSGRIKRQEEKIELLKEQKKGYMQKIFNRELRFKDDNGNAFIECREHKFADFLKIPLKEKEGNPIKEKLLTVKLHLKGVAVNENVSTLKIGSTTYYKRKAGQFIYGKQNLFNGAFGIVPDYLDGYLSSGDIPTLDFHVVNIEPYYFFYYLSQRDVYKRLENISTGTGSKRIYEAELLKQKIKLPCIKEQQRIVHFLSSMDRKIDREEEKLEALQEQQKGFMQQMFI